MSYAVILPYNYIKTCLPALPYGVSKIIYSFYNSLQPCVRELQDWFGEDSYKKNYHDTQYERSQILEFVDVNKYCPNTFINKIMQTDYFKSHQIIYCTDGIPRHVEIKSITRLLDFLRRKNTV